MEKVIIKECKIHGETNFALRKDNRYQCRQCNTDAVIKRRKAVKEKAVEHMGGKCQICGYNKYVGALQFHHLDPNTKDFHISQRGHSRSWEKVKSEIEKCILVCGNCHSEIHGGLINLDKITIIK